MEAISNWIQTLITWLSTPAWDGISGVIAILSLGWGFYSNFRLNKSNEGNRQNNYLLDNYNLFFEYEKRKNRIANEFEGMSKALAINDKNIELIWQIFRFSNSTKENYKNILAKDEKKILEILTISQDSLVQMDTKVLCDSLIRLSSKIRRNRKDVDLDGCK